MMTSDDKVGGWVKKSQNHDDVILECPLSDLHQIFLFLKTVAFITGKSENPADQNIFSFVFPLII